MENCRWSCLRSIAVICMLLPARILFAQNLGVVVDQSLVQTVTIENPKYISFFAEDFLIPEKQIEWLKIYDLSGDGFGNGDLVRTYPGARFYTITASARAQKVMNSWSFGGNIKFTADSYNSSDLFEQVPDSVRAMGGIFASLLRGLRRNYSGLPIKLYMEQNNNVTAIEMWGYNPEMMNYQPPPLPKVLVEEPVMKLIYLEKTIVDSVLYAPKVEAGHGAR